MAKEPRISIEIQADGLKQAIKRVPKEVARAIRGAGRETGNAVLDTRGLRAYPPHTSANVPPAPYYQRGKGTIYAGGGSDNSSENLGKQWSVNVKPYGVIIGNRASYAEYVHGDKQPRFHQVRGWRKLTGVVRQKVATGEIGRIFNKWIGRALRRAGLK
jgi:hypothetical protein